METRTDRNVMLPIKKVHQSDRGRAPRSKGSPMVTPDDICLAAEETCQSGVFVHLVALRLKEISEEFSVADLIGQVTLVVESNREASNN